MISKESVAIAAPLASSDLLLSSVAAVSDPEPGIPSSATDFVLPSGSPSPIQESFGLIVSPVAASDCPLEQQGNLHMITDCLRSRIGFLLILLLQIIRLPWKLKLKMSNGLAILLKILSRASRLNTLLQSLDSIF